jgi:hypothetical protein
MMEAVCSSETLVTAFKFKRRYYHEDKIDIFTAVGTLNLSLIIIETNQLTDWISYEDGCLLGCCAV